MSSGFSSSRRISNAQARYGRRQAAQPFHRFLPASQIQISRCTRSFWLELAALLNNLREESNKGFLLCQTPLVGLVCLELFFGCSNVAKQPRVCLLLQDLVQSCWRGGGGYGRTCATRDDEPRPVWTRPCVPSSTAPGKTLRPRPCTLPAPLLGATIDLGRRRTPRRLKNAVAAVVGKPSASSSSSSTSSTSSPSTDAFETHLPIDTGKRVRRDRLSMWESDWHVPGAAVRYRFVLNQGTQKGF
jgi:hypothetical protein